MLYLVVCGFIILFFLGIPVVLSITIPSLIYLIAHDFPLTMIAQRFHYALNSFPLIAVPVFIFAGNLMNTSGHTRRIFEFADNLVGRIHGGVAQVNIFASLIFSGMSGAALADVGGLGQIEISAMEERGFGRPYSAAVTAASATVGPIFPPSIPLVIYGAVTGASVVKLLMGGILPAVLAVIMMMLITAALSIIRKYPRADRMPGVSVIWRSFKKAFPSLLAPVFLIFGMLSGQFTPTEAASVTVVYIVFISLFIYKDFSFKQILNSAYSTIKATASIMIIVASASLFSWIMAVEGVPLLFNDLIARFSQNPVVLLLFVNVLMLFVGMILDSTTATILVIPIIVPPVLAAGIDPIHLGIVIIFNLMIGLITPPMGLSLFLVSDIARVPMTSVLKEVAPYFLTLIFVLLLITFIPIVSTYIPGFLG